MLFSVFEEFLPANSHKREEKKSRRARWLELVCVFLAYKLTENIFTFCSIKNYQVFKLPSRDERSKRIASSVAAAEVERNTGGARRHEKY